MKIRLVSKNNVFAYKGQAFEATDGQGNPRDYTVSAKTAEELVDRDNARFRRVDDDGKVVPNAQDEEKTSAKVSKRAGRTVSTTSELMGKGEGADDTSDNEKEAEDDAGAGKEPTSDAESKAKPKGSVTITTKRKAKPAERDKDTEGAVEV